MVFPNGTHRKVLAGLKSEIRLPAKPGEEHCKFRKDRDYAIQTRTNGSALGRVRVLAVDRQRLGDITLDSVRREGFKSQAEFVNHWVSVYHDWNDATKVFVIVFMLANDPVRLLARDSSRGYTHHPKLAMQHEPEAVDVHTQRKYAEDARANEDRRRQLMRSRLAQLREAGIKSIKNGGDPTPVLDSALDELGKLGK